MNVTKFHVDDLKNSQDITSIRGELQAMEGVHAVRVDDVANTITVEYDNNVNTDKITNAINKHKSMRS
ncbi:MAG: heavy-metal-associated domain-containing protein [Caulobacteraceae bacterium]